jgi:type IV pilus assembly protein PilW
MLIHFPHKAHNFQKGFSLIELMIAMTLGLLLMSGVVQIFLSSKQAYSTISGSSETLDNGRLGLHFISSSISKGGYWGDVSFIRAYGSDEALTATQTAGTNTPYNDSYSGRFINNSYIFGLNNDATDVGVVDGTDQFFIRFNGHDINPMTNCAGGSVNAQSVAIERFYLSTVNGSESLPSLVCETSVLVLDQTTGDISLPADPEIKTQVLISGVENMQILYGQRSLDHSTVRYYTAADVTDWELVESLRIALLAASSEEVNSVTRTTGYNLLDVTTSVPTDRRARKVFERTVAMRNINYDDSE